MGAHVTGARAATGDDELTAKSLDAAAAAILGQDQGVYVETADGSILVSRAAARPVHPASVSKIPTTLALLRKLGPEHRFITTFSLAGCIVGETLHGDLVVHGDGDPSLVDEDALLVAENLKRLGITRVLGGLHVTGPLTFDWQSDADGARLQRALSGTTPAAAWSAVKMLAVSASYGATPDVVDAPAIPFGNQATGAAATDEALVYRSQPLLSLLKSLNDYSNNIFKPFADAAGGPTAVQALARSLVPQSMQSEITLGDGAGSDPANRLSPRAAVKLLRALEQELAGSGHTLLDALPVAGIDQGTLLHRLDSPDEIGRVVGKTGTFGDYGASALVGAIRTRDRGTVYFAVLNHGVPVPRARKRQDRFVQALLRALDTVPWEYERDIRPAVARAEVTVHRPASFHSSLNCDAGSSSEAPPPTAGAR
jgi:serine-type D-Ala-D-Ala carboxypeptidase/endopeptidase (penicillin-binding protein 4)